MRIKLVLNATSTNFLTHNYNDPFSLALRTLLKLDSPEFKAYMQALPIAKANNYIPLFSFAIRFQRFIMMREHICLISPKIFCIISVTIIDKYFIDLILPEIRGKSFYVKGKDISTEFMIEEMEIFNEGEFTNEMKFTSLSPIVVASSREYKKKPITYFLRFHDDMQEWNRLINVNLRRKYESLYQNDALNKTVIFTWEEKFLNKYSAKGKNITRKQILYDVDNEPVEIIGNVAPFYVTGDADLIRIGYNMGFGDYNHLGFGLTEIVKQEDSLYFNLQSTG